MGHGIAQIAAQGGYKVIVSEADQGALDKGLSRIEKSLAKLAEKLVEKGKKSAEEAEADKAAAAATADKPLLSPKVVALKVEAPDPAGASGRPT